MVLKEFKIERIKGYVIKHDELLIFCSAFLIEILFGLILVSKYGSTIFNVDSSSYLYHARIVIDNGQYSGFSSLVGTWLPLFQIFLIPFVMIEKLYVTGFAGTIVSAVMTGGTGVFLYKLAGGRNSRFAILAPVIFMSNIYTLIFGAIAMSEQTAIFFMVVASYFFKNYLSSGETKPFITCSIALILGSLVRYEIWAVAVFVSAVFLVKEIRNNNVHRVAHVHLPVWGIIAWLFMNLMIHRDMFWFNNNASSNRMQTEVFSKYFFGSIDLSLNHALIEMTMIYGLLLYLAIISIVLIIILNKTRDLIPLAIFFIPSALNVALMIEGQSMGWPRFFYISIPGMVLLTVYFFENISSVLNQRTDTINKLFKGHYSSATSRIFVIVCIIIGLSVIAVAIHASSGNGNTEYSLKKPDRPWIFQGLDMSENRISLEIRTKDDVYRNDISFEFSRRTAYQDYSEIKKYIGPERILMPAFSMSGNAEEFSVSQGISPDQIIDSYDYLEYNNVMAEPWNYTSYVVFPNITREYMDKLYGNDTDSYIYRYYYNETWRSLFLSHYTPVFEGEGLKLYELDRWSGK